MDASLPDHLTAAETSALGDLKRAVADLLGRDLEEMILFGSRARGEGGESSDLDVAVVVADGRRPKRYEIYDLAYDVGLARGVVLSPLVIEVSQLQELRDRERLLASDLDHDGIPL